MGVTITWTDEQENAIRDDIAAGFCARNIARRINERFGTRYSRHAIVGYAARADLTLQQEERRGPVIEWTEEQASIIRDGLAAGLGAREVVTGINERFGLHYTRHAVIGYAARHGISRNEGKPQPAIEWTDEQSGIIRDGIGEGLSAQQVADRINGRFGKRHTRNAIVGFATRNGLTFKPQLYGHSSWTEEHTDALRADVPNFSSSQIAIRLNERFGTRYTRCSVIGRARRIGLSFPAPVKMPHKPRTYKPRNTSVARIRDGGGGTQRIVRGVMNMAQIRLRCVEIECAVPFADYTGCSYPSKEPPFLFCNGPQQKGSSYCVAHHALCNEPARPARESGYREMVA